MLHRGASAEGDVICKVFEFFTPDCVAQGGAPQSCGHRI
jgi:hypothetical protein